MLPYPKKLPHFVVCMPDSAVAPAAATVAALAFCAACFALTDRVDPHVVESVSTIKVMNPQRTASEQGAGRKSARTPPPPPPSPVGATPSHELQIFTFRRARAKHLGARKTSKARQASRDVREGAASVMQELREAHRAAQLREDTAMEQAAQAAMLAEAAARAPLLVSRAVRQSELGNTSSLATRCHGRGVYHAGVKECRCTAGWAGEQCETREARPCNKLYGTDRWQQTHHPASQP